MSKRNPDAPRSRTTAAKPAAGPAVDPLEEPVEARIEAEIEAEADPEDSGALSARRDARYPGAGAAGSGRMWTLMGIGVAAVAAALLLGYLLLAGGERWDAPPAPGAAMIAIRFQRLSESQAKGLEAAAKALATDYAPEDAPPATARSTLFRTYNGDGYCRVLFPWSGRRSPAGFAAAAKSVLRDARQEHLIETPLTLRALVGPPPEAEGAAEAGVEGRADGAGVAGGGS